MKPLIFVTGIAVFLGLEACNHPEGTGQVYSGVEVPEELLIISKNLPPGFEVQTLLALSYYPELKDVRIDFIVKDAFIPLSSRPFMKSLFKKRENRRYKVIISDGRIEGMEPVLLEYAEYVRNVFESQGQSTRFMDRYYLNPAEIKAVMEEYNLPK